jgi:hypothetical protein
VPELFGIGPKGDDVDATIGLLRGDVDRAHDVPGGAMPGQTELSGATFDGGDDRVGDVLVNVEAFFCHGRSPLLAGRAIAASWGKRDRDH